MTLKVNLQKIIAVVVSTAVITFSFISFSVSADDETGMTNQEYYAAQSYLVAKYKDGDISYSEFQQQSQAVTDEFVSKNTVGGVLQSGALNASNTFNAVSQKIGDTVQKYGDSAREHISDCVSDFFNDYIKLSDVPTTDLDGSTAFYRQYYDDGSGYEEVYCRTPGIVRNRTEGNESWKEYLLKDCYRKKVYKNNGVLLFDYKLSGTEELVSNRYGRNKRLELYGKWVMESGELADTDDEFQTISDYDFSEAPERELEDLLKKILNEFELQQPDLSSIEGLLNAIYARLGTLDSDNDNELLSQILTAIYSLDKVGDSVENTELKKILEDLKESLVYEDGENIYTISEQLKRIIDNQLTIDDFAINETEYNNRLEVLKLRLLGKFSFVHNLSEFITYIFESYRESSDNPEISFEYNGNIFSVNFSCYEDVLPLAQVLIASFVYITYAYHTYRKVPSYINGGDNE